MKIITFSEFAKLPGQVIYIQIPKKRFVEAREKGYLDLTGLEQAVRTEPMHHENQDCFLAARPFSGVLGNIIGFEDVEMYERDILIDGRTTFEYDPCIDRETDRYDENMYLVFEPADVQQMIQRMLQWFPTEAAVAIVEFNKLG